MKGQENTKNASACKEDRFAAVRGAAATGLLYRLARCSETAPMRCAKLRVWKYSFCSKKAEHSRSVWTLGCGSDGQAWAAKFDDPGQVYE